MPGHYGEAFPDWVELQEVTANGRAMLSSETEAPPAAVGQAPSKRNIGRLRRACWVTVILILGALSISYGLRWQEERCEDNALAEVLRRAQAESTDLAAGGPLPKTLLPNLGPVMAAEFSPDGKRVVTASYEGTARVWDAQTGDLVGSPLRHDSAVNHASFSPDGQRVITTSYDNTARVWDARTGEPLTAPLWHHPLFDVTELIPPGARPFIPSSLLNLLPVHEWFCSLVMMWPTCGPVVSAMFSPDGQRLVAVSDDGDSEWRVRLWDASSGRLLTEPLHFDREVTTAAFSPDGQRVVTASSDVRILDAHSGQLIIGPLRHKDLDLILFAGFSPDGSRVVSASSDGSARVWDAQSGRAVTGFMWHDDAVTFADFSPDGRRLVTTSRDGTARLWDSASGQPVTGPLRHDDGVLSARFSPDGRYLVTNSNDGTARLWDARTGLAVAPPLRHRSSVTSASFSSDGRRLVTSSTDGLGRIWELVDLVRPEGATGSHSAPNDGDDEGRSRALISARDRSSPEQRATLQNISTALQQIVEDEEVADRDRAHTHPAVPSADVSQKNCRVPHPASRSNSSTSSILRPNASSVMRAFRHRTRGSRCIPALTTIVRVSSTSESSRDTTPSTVPRLPRVMD